MILICQNLRNNLQHPDEFIRGVTLRFLYRLNDLRAATAVDPVQSRAPPPVRAAKCGAGRYVGLQAAAGGAVVGFGAGDR